MNKTWTIVEKAIGTILAAWGMFALYSVLTTIFNMIISGFAASQHITYLQLFIKNHLNLLLSPLAILAGSILWFNDRKGWLMAIICALMYVITFARSSDINARDNAAYSGFYKSYTMMCLLFLTMLVLLLQKPFWQKYHSTARDWLWVSVVAVVLIADKFVF